MTESDYYYNKASQERIYSDLQHEAIMNELILKNEMALFSTLNPVLSKDGNQWCCLLGENLQTGICGFGNTPYLAILYFNKSFYKPQPQPHDQPKD